MIYVASDVMVEVKVDHISGETSPTLLNKSVDLCLLRKKDLTAKDVPPAKPRHDKTLVVRPAGVWARGLPLKFPALFQLS